MHPILKRLIRLQNPFMKALLRSPLHGLVSRIYMLLIVTGRKTGRLYETPVQYAQTGETLWVITSAVYTWWRNLMGGATVEVILRGQRYQATVTPYTDADRIRAALHCIYPRFSPQQIESFVVGKVALEIRLT